MVAPLSRDRLTRHWWAVQVVYPAVREPSLFAMHIIHLIPLLAKPAAESLQNSVGKFVRPFAIVRMRRCRTFQADQMFTNCDAYKTLSVDSHLSRASVVNIICTHDTILYACIIKSIYNYTFPCAHSHASARTCACVRGCVRVRNCVYVRMRACACTCVRMHTWVRACMRLLRAHVHVCWWLWKHDVG